VTIPIGIVSDKLSATPRAVKREDPEWLNRESIERSRKLAASGDCTRAEIAEMVQVSLATLCRALHSL
jgi:hypothetical protein